ncbi:Serine/threonine-protein phosphatase PP2A-2 catalytic subunit [Tritrichomonas foetus]|uniref:Serine/threonine-protein phosphatase n=1 Tax=Tritrichomonas foetus TaxID=1144522 RepID=A0A1J4KMC1_9EUKA|nr:Serine/threonine-protein phosphatase PP2A-2 catalytic subunit [Tritrichomonas foetus]|eukprot:OHT12290.1 Serine/threonine-protein phosphatase PP2A-2 catalytic subunit [Tritrichomonas foetus]
MDADRIQFEAIFQFYSNLFNTDVKEYTTRNRQLSLPIIPQKIMILLLHAAIQIFKNEPVTLRTSGPVIVVGDLHGQVLDLIRILKVRGPPPNTHYIFLGDLVDRGQFSTETVTLVLVMKVLWPNEVILLRGNHEFDELCKIGGFGTEITNIYSSDEISGLFSLAFGCIPIACIVNKSIVCLHGGIGPTVKRLSDIDKMPRPLYAFPDGPVTDILWSDPSDVVEMFRTSSRGSGALFGELALTMFLEQEGLDLLVRGHQCVSTGVAASLNGKCVTVFSASNYCGISGNKSGILVINAENVISHEEFDPLSLLYRAEVKFLQSKSPTAFIVPIEMVTLSIPQNSPPENKQRGTARASRPQRSSLQIKKLDPVCHTGRDEIRSPLIRSPPQRRSKSIARTKYERGKPPVPLPSLKKRR